MSAQLVLVDQTVICSAACSAEVRIVTDGIAAYAITGDQSRASAGGTRTGTVVEVLCPARDHRWGITSEDRCHEVLVVDLSAPDAWEPATPEALALLAHGGRLDG